MRPADDPVSKHEFEAFFRPGPSGVIPLADGHRALVADYAARVVQRSAPRIVAAALAAAERQAVLENEGIYQAWREQLRAGTRRVSWYAPGPTDGDDDLPPAA